jgi:prevent-host-death family protein
LVATGSYHGTMKVGIKDAKNRLTELLREVEAGRTVTITRDGEPVVDLVKHIPRKKGLNWEGLREYKLKHGIGQVVDYIPDDFDDPLPEDFLIKPLPILPTLK